jgi:predicted deacetylase
MIARGKELLRKKELATDIFMAPAHSYDKNTIKALGQLGFRYVTDGYSLFPYIIGSLKFIPCQSSKPVGGLFGSIPFACIPII